MKADLTRDTFDPTKHFTRVLMQQGRVQVDADCNEQASILLRYLRALAADLIGPAGGPVAHCGFGLGTDGEFPGDFRLSPGRYYVDGILCELETSMLPVTTVPGRSTNDVGLSALVLDGVAFRKPVVGQAQPYVEVIGQSGASVVAQIVDFDFENRVLTLSKDVSAVLKAQPAVLRRVVTYRTQPDLPVPPDTELENNQSYLAYLDVWERLVTYVEDDAVREVALGGADTAARARVVWQVKLVAGAASATYGNPCDAFVPTESDFLAHLDQATHGRLKAMAKQDAQATDPCLTPPHARYRGVENQLYRVEVHTGGTAWDGDGESPNDGAATFKWSRENGSVIFPVLSVVASSASKTTSVELESLGRDERFGLREGDWVELVNDDLVLTATPSALLQVQAVDRSAMRVTLTGLADATFAQDPAKHPLLRRWDQQQGDPTEGGSALAADGAAFILESDGVSWLELEDGVKVQFQPSGASQPYRYRSGDYWLIPARVASGDVEWPRVSDTVTGEVAPVALPPKGIEHRYAPLGVIHVDAQGGLHIAPCRKQFGPLAKRPDYDYAFPAVGIGTSNLVLRPSAKPRGKKKPVR
jgi:hypothetical protein